MLWENKTNDVIAGFIIAVIFLFSYASAAEYNSCPFSVQVNNAFWNNNYCEGGIHSFGSLNMIWDNIPVDNETIEIKSVVLKMRAQSVGTYITISIWNGYSWTTVSGGRIDLNSDYKFDLRNIPREYSDGSYRFKITNNDKEDLNIDSINLDIVYESKLRSVFVYVDECKTGEKAEDVEITFDGVTKNTFSDGYSEFEVSKGKVYEIEITGEDYYPTNTRLFVEDDSDVSVCLVKNEITKPKVLDLDVYDEAVSFTLKNIGNVDGDIQYIVYVDGKSVSEDVVFLEVGEEDDIYFYHDFIPGKCEIEVVAIFRGETDTVTENHCVRGETQNYMCRNNEVLVEVYKSGCYKNWEVIDTCNGDCAEVCENLESESSGSTESSCNFELTSVSYQDKIVSGDMEELLVKVNNLGSTPKNIELKLFVNDRLIEKKNAFVYSGSSEEIEINFRLYEGENDIRIDLYACGKLSDSISKSIDVMPEPAEYIPPVDEIPMSPVLDDNSFLVIEIENDNITALPCEGIPMEVTLHSQVSDSFNIEVYGIDPEDLDYPDNIEVWGRETFFVYLKTPEKPGTYYVYIEVSNGELREKREVQLNIVDDFSNNIDNDSFSGMFLNAESGWLGFVIVGVIVAIVFIIFFNRFYMQAGENYDFQALEYDQSVREASLVE